MMKINLIVLSTLLITFAFDVNMASAQFIEKIPKIKIGKSEKEQPKNKEATTETGKTNTPRTNTPRTNATAAGPIYKPQRPTSVPVFLKNSVYVQAITHDQYWKAPNQRNYSSWVPRLRFSYFYNNDRALSYTVDYFNPDGSSWYSEKLEQGFSGADRTVSYQSPSPYGGVLDTKSTVGTGIYGFKVTDDDSKEVLYQGKFKVGKFSRAQSPQEKNKADFYVDHDWLMPFAMIGFHHSLDTVGGMEPEVSVWIKGPVDAKELEGRVFYKGQQIASTREEASGVSDYDERASGYAVAFAPQNYWKRWQFGWNNLRFDNNGTFNRDYYPKAHYADKNPGEYVVKIYRNGEQIRELSFEIGADGRIVVPAYMNQFFLPYYRVILPAKVIGASEKWNATAWKSEAFYGNPPSGFMAQ
jgi:hypothetical protein